MADIAPAQPVQRPAPPDAVDQAVLGLQLAQAIVVASCSRSTGPFIVAQRPEVQ